MKVMPFLSVLMIYSTFVGCNRNKEIMPVQQQTPSGRLELMFKSRHDLDVYHHNDPYGTQYIIAADTFTVYRMYVDTTLETRIRYEWDRTTLLPTELCDSLIRLFRLSGFSAYPAFIPSTNQVRWPSRYIYILYLDPDWLAPKNVQGLTTADSVYYPTGFFGFLRQLDLLIERAMLLPNQALKLTEGAAVQTNASTQT
ncbi:MAG: hypothetical protein KIT50_13520 [Bacteroidetes bacterium]|nr:hypothetical protein [Bacteroidota bacterium]MCW5896609.1 hypothetical protein [Bacteroidota bacterium]